MINFLVTFLFKIIELFTQNFYEFKVYKKSVVCNRKTPNSHSNICLLMQGPLIEKKNFTFESLKWYKSCNPDISIIFSTWNSQNQNTIKKLRNLGIYDIENDLPKVKWVILDGKLSTGLLKLEYLLKVKWVILDGKLSTGKLK